MLRVFIYAIFIVIVHARIYFVQLTGRDASGLVYGLFGAQLRPNHVTNSSGMFGRSRLALSAWMPFMRQCVNHT